MKLFFLSDIHGSMHFLAQALRRYEIEGAERIILLGDVLYHGARNPLPEGYNPKEVAAALNAAADRIIAVRGNCDSEVDEMVLAFPVMASYSNLLVGSRRFFLTHGHLFSDANPPKLAKGDALIFGHTHVPRAEKTGDLYVINPGSISMPKEETPRCYGILENDSFTIKTLSGETYKSLQLG